MGGEIVTVEKPGAEGAEEGGEGGGDGSNEEAIAEGLEKHSVMEKGIIPFESETFPDEATFRLVEGKKNHKKNRDVEEGKDESGPGATEPANEFGAFGEAKESYPTQWARISHQEPISRQEGSGSKKDGRRFSLRYRGLLEELVRRRRSG
jgi:hypothetical protein